MRFLITFFIMSPTLVFSISIGLYLALYSLAQIIGSGMSSHSLQVSTAMLKAGSAARHTFSQPPGSIAVLQKPFQFVVTSSSVVS